MPKLSCRACGRQVYTAATIDSLFAEERRCPRCGALMDPERRVCDRRQAVRRQDAPDDPWPPGTGERRFAERRMAQRREHEAEA